MLADFSSFQVSIELFRAIYFIYRYFREREIPSESVVGREYSVLDPSDFLSQSHEEQLLKEWFESLIPSDREDIFAELEERMII